MHVCERIGGLRLKPGRRAVSRTVVNYERLNMGIGLRLDRVEANLYPLAPIERGDDDAY